MNFEILFIISLVVLQVAVFFGVLKKIKKYEMFFPISFSEIKIKRFPISKYTLNDPERFDSYLDSFSDNTELAFEGDDDFDEVELLVVPSSTRLKHHHFYDVIKSTNAYLSKNKGASADFSILKDTCERHLEKVDNEIGNLINVPLYIGLGGTFVGIIIGLWNIDFRDVATNATTISVDSIAQLLNGVIAAMFASLIGLTFTVINSALFYKPAAFKNDTDKNHYYDFLQRELLPFLNTGVSKSLGTFKDVLNHFIIKFGENMDDYKDSGHLLNENLQKQQAVLEEINRLSLTKTSTKIVEIFSQLNDSANHLSVFQSYQKGLNAYIDNTDKVVQDINLVIENFKEFNYNLKSVTEFSVANIELQKQFKDSLEKHFPTISDHREVWRSQVDDLNKDIKEIYKELNIYFKTSTDQIQSFIGNNQNFFNGINEIQNSIRIFVENSALQNEGFKYLVTEFGEMRKDFKEAQLYSIEMNKSMIDAIIDLKKTFALFASQIEK